MKVLAKAGGVVIAAATLVSAPPAVGAEVNVYSARQCNSQSYRIWTNVVCDKCS